MENGPTSSHSKNWQRTVSLCSLDSALADSQVYHVCDDKQRLKLPLIHIHSSGSYHAASSLASNLLVIKYSWAGMARTVPSAHLHIQSVATNHCMPFDSVTGMGHCSATDLISIAHISSSPTLLLLSTSSQRPSNSHAVSSPCMLSGSSLLDFYTVRQKNCTVLFFCNNSVRSFYIKIRAADFND